MSYYYRLFGFSAVSNVSVPGLNAQEPTRAQIQIFLGRVPPKEKYLHKASETLTFTSSVVAESGTPALEIFSSSDGNFIHLVYDDGMEFWFDNIEKTIWGNWPDPLTMADAASYLLGPVLGLVLRQTGTTCLHASAVEIAGKAVIFAGDSGAGKSTTAAAMSCRGYAVLADDIVAIAERDHRFLAVPAYPYLSLWPESVKILYGTEVELPRVSLTFPKQQLSLGTRSNDFQQTAVEIGTIFILGARESSPAPRVETLTPRDALLALVSNSYASRALDARKRANEFEFFARLVRSVRIQRVVPSDDPGLIGRLCETLVASCQ